MLSLLVGFFLPPLLLVLQLLYQYLGRLRPLNNIPNAHPTAPFSSLWLSYIQYRKRENCTIWKLHKKFGSVIRLSPDEISVCTLEGVKTIYGGWDKSPWYETFTNYEPPLVALLHSAPHAARKRLIANIYSKSYLQSSPDICTFNSTILTQRLLPKVATSAATGSPIDVLRLSTAYGMDVMSAYAFGSGDSTKFLEDDTACSRFLSAFTAVKSGLFWAGRFPNLTRTLQHIGIDLIPLEAIHGQAEIEDICLKLCSRVQTTMEKASIESSNTAPVVFAQLSTSLAKGINKLSFEDPTHLDHVRKSVASEILDHLIAGHETTGIALTYTMYELSMHPGFQAALHAELRSIEAPLIFPIPVSESNGLSPSISGPRTLPRTLDALPLLNAALYETLRLYPPGAAGQPRVVPLGGATLCGFVLPEGVVAHAAAYSLHRNAAVYERAEEWLPERWLGERKKEISDWFWAFGSGSRGCIGKSFAVQEMLIFLAAIYTNYNSHIVDAEGIEPVDAFIAGPRAGRLILRFDKV